MGRGPPNLGIEIRTGSEVGPAPENTPGVIVALLPWGYYDPGGANPMGILVFPQFSESNGCPPLANGQPLAVELGHLSEADTPFFPKLG